MWKDTIAKQNLNRTALKMASERSPIESQTLSLNLRIDEEKES